MLGILLSFVIIDYITGVVVAGIEGKLNSSIDLKGIVKKVGVFVIVAVANLVDKALGDVSETYTKVVASSGYPKGSN